MSAITVTTQAELDAALREHGDDASTTIIIDSPRGVWVTISDTGKATVEAWGSATVRAWDSATVRASRYVAVHRFSERVTISGGVVIDVTDVHASTDPALWCDYHGIEIDSGGLAHLYKAVDDDLCAGHAYVKTAYRLGSDPTCDEWADNNECGRGLHACPSPRQALAYFPRATRFLEVTAPVETLRPIDATKVKALTFHVLREVDLDGRPL